MQNRITHLNLSKPSDLNETETKETWELSMAWSWMPESAQSHVASFKRSFRDSRTFFSRFPWTSLASNILERIWYNLQVVVWLQEQMPRTWRWAAAQRVELGGWNWKITKTILAGIRAASNESSATKILLHKREFITAKSEFFNQTSFSNRLRE